MWHRSQNRYFYNLIVDHVKIWESKAHINEQSRIQVFAEVIPVVVVVLHTLFMIVLNLGNYNILPCVLSFFVNKRKIII